MKSSDLLFFPALGAFSAAISVISESKSVFLVVELEVVVVVHMYIIGKKIEL